MIDFIAAMLIITMITKIILYLLIIKKMIKDIENGDLLIKRGKKYVHQLIKRHLILVKEKLLFKH